MHPTTTQRQALAAQAEAVIDANDLHGQTAWAYGTPGACGQHHHTTARKFSSHTVIVVCADGNCYLDCDGHSPVHWHEADDNRAVDATLRELQQDDDWVELFTLNACACEGDGRVYLNGNTCYILRDASQAYLDAHGILSDEGRLFTRCTCGADEAR